MRRLKAGAAEQAARLAVRRGFRTVIEAYLEDTYDCTYEDIEACT